MPPHMDKLKKKTRGCMERIYKKRFGNKVVAKLSIFLVPEVGIEPTWSCPRGILSSIFLKTEIS